MIPTNFNTIASPVIPINGVIPVGFTELPVVPGRLPRIRVSALVPAGQRWFIQENTSNPDLPADWFTVPSSQQDGSMVFYDAGIKAGDNSLKWWRAIRKS